VEKLVTVEAGKPVELEFELRFDRAKHDAALELGRRLEQDEQNTSPSTSE
jgi:hypothetical protein